MDAMKIGEKEKKEEDDEDGDLNWYAKEYVDEAKPPRRRRDASMKSEMVQSVVQQQAAHSLTMN